MQVSGLGALTRHFLLNGWAGALLDRITESGLEPPKLWEQPKVCTCNHIVLILEGCRCGYEKKPDLPTVHLPLLKFVANFDASRQERKAASKLVRSTLRYMHHRDAQYLSNKRRLRRLFNNYIKGD